MVSSAITTATSGTEATDDGSIAMTSVAMTTADGNRMVITEYVLLRTFFLPPSGVSMEQTQALLGLAIAGHLVLELASLLSEGAGAIMDPFIAVNLLALATGDDKSVADTSIIMLRVTSQDEGVLAIGSLSNDVVDARLQHTATTSLVTVPSSFRDAIPQGREKGAQSRGEWKQLKS